MVLAHPLPYGRCGYRTLTTKSMAYEKQPMRSRLFRLPILAQFFASIRLDKKAADIVLNKRVGIWVDSKKAFIVSVVKDELDAYNKPKTRLMRIDSDVDSHIRLSGGSRSRQVPYGPQEISVDGKIDARRRRQLHKYFQEIIRHVEDAEKILIFGPGRAKLELEKEFLKFRRFASRVLPVETTDKMTEGQITAKVKAFFNANSLENEE